MACRAQPDGTRKRSAEPHPLLLSLDHAFGLGFPLRSSGTNTGNFRVTHPTPAAGSAFQARGLPAQAQLSEVCQPATAFSSRFDTQMQTTNLPSLSESTSRRALFFSFYRADLVTIPNTGGTTIPSPHPNTRRSFEVVLLSASFCGFCAAGRSPRIFGRGKSYYPFSRRFTVHSLPSLCSVTAQPFCSGSDERCWPAKSCQIPQS